MISFLIAFEVGMMVYDASAAEIVAGASEQFQKVYSRTNCETVDETKARAALDRLANCSTDTRNKSTDDFRDITQRVEANAEDGFFRALGGRHARELQCAADYAQSLSRGEERALRSTAAKFRVLRDARRVWLEGLKDLKSDRVLAGRGCPQTLDELNQDRDNRKFVATCRSVIVAKATYESVQASLPLSALSDIKAASDRYANDPSEDERGLADRIKAAYGRVQGSLESQSKALSARSARPQGGEFTPDEKAELLSDPSVVESVVSTDKDSLSSVSCRVDARYGTGRKNLIMALNIGTMAFGGSAFAVARGAGWMAKFAQATNAARSTGQISANTVRILQAGVVASTMATVVTDVSHICRPSGWRDKASSQSCRSAPSAERIESEGCALAATLTGLNAASILPSPALAMLMIPGKMAAEVAQAKTLGRGARDFNSGIPGDLDHVNKIANDRLTQSTGRNATSESLSAMSRMGVIPEGPSGTFPIRKPARYPTKDEAAFLRASALDARSRTDPTQVVDVFLDKVGAHPSIREFVRTNPESQETRDLFILLKQPNFSASALKEQLSDLAAASARQGAKRFYKTSQAKGSDLIKDPELVTKREEIDKIANQLGQYSPQAGRESLMLKMNKPDAYSVEAPLGCAECANFPNGDVSFKKIFISHVESHAYDLTEAARFRELELKMATVQSPEDKAQIFSEMKALGIVRLKSATSFSLIHDDITMAPELFGRAKNLKRIEYPGVDPAIAAKNPVVLYTFDADTEMAKWGGSHVVTQKYRIAVCNAVPGEKCIADGVKFDRGDAMTFFPECGEFVLRAPSAKSLSTYYLGGAGKQRDFTLEKAPCQ